MNQKAHLLSTKTGRKGTENKPGTDAITTSKQLEDVENIRKLKKKHF